MALQPVALLTMAEYLAQERVAAERHEYLDGHVYAMAGESPAHGQICVNLIISLGTHLRGGPCQVFTKDMKVWCEAPRRRAHDLKGLFAYPDLVVVCGALQFHDEVHDILVNPAVILEVLSPSTEAFDRGEKSRRYRTHLPTLTDYVLIAQEQPVVDHYHRTGAAGWQWHEIAGLEAHLHIAALDWTVRLADIYERVVFEPADA